jgi:HEAT repeat protein
MNQLKKVSVVFLLISVMIFACVSAYAQPTIPKEEIPEDIPGNVRTQIERLYSEDSAERIYSADELGELGKKASAALPYLIKALGEDSEIIVFRGGGAISPGLAAFRALPKIDPDWENREAAKEKFKQMMPDLIRAIESPNIVMYIRAAATEYLTKVKDPVAIEPLIAALKDKNEPFTQLVSQTLTEITGQDFGEDQAKWKQWWDENKDEILKSR